MAVANTGMYGGGMRLAPSVSVSQARSVVLDADRPFRVFADGDPVATLPCTVTVKSAALKVLIPA